MRLPRSLFICSIAVITSSLFFFYVFFLTLLLKRPIVFFLVMFGVQAVLLAGAGVAMLTRLKFASFVLGIATAWYICWFALTGIHGYFGYGIAVLFVLIMLDHNRFERREKLSNKAQLETTNDG